MYGVPLQNTGAGQRVGYKFGIVVIKYRLARRNAGQYAFAASGISRKKMGFNKAFAEQSSAVLNRIGFANKTGNNGSGYRASR
jgi:hypothetical protein